MRLLLGAALLCLTLRPGQGSEEAAPHSPGQQDSQAQSSFSDWGIDTIRDGFETVNSYFDSFLELLGGKNGVCQYRCRYGKAPMPRPHYKPQEPNGCSSHFLGLKLDLGIPAMTKCCNQLDICYDTCGANKYRCDAKFRWCLHSICSDLKRSLGFVSKVQGRTLPPIPGAGSPFLAKKMHNSAVGSSISKLHLSQVGENTEICPLCHTLLSQGWRPTVICI
nr:group XIIB secretory phospholipase A2-like protein isoform X2 [Taeniopygia guttata]